MRSSGRVPGKRQPPYGIILAVIAVLLVGGGILLWTMLAGPAAPTETAQNTTPPTALPAQGDEGSGIPYPNVARISLEEARQRFDAGTALFVDTRSAESFAAEHIVGALALSSPDLDARLKSLPADSLIITYCT